MRKLILIVSTLIISFQLLAQNNRYWVNGNGNWHDQSHWSLTSGGQGGASVPDEQSNVIIDENSFSSTNSFIKLSDNAECNNFTFNSALNGIKGRADVVIYGSINVVPDASFNKFKGALVFKASDKSNLELPVELASDLVFKGENGEWELNSNLSTKGDIKYFAGSINTNNNHIKADAFVTMGKENRNLDLGESLVSVNEWDFSESKNLSLKTSDAHISIPKKIDKNFKSGGLGYNSVSSSAKAVPVAVTPTDASCPAGASVSAGQESKLKDGELNILIDGGAGNYYVTLWDDVIENEIDRQFGNNLDFTELESGGYFFFVRTGSYGGSVVASATATVGPDTLVASIAVHQDVSCYGTNDLQLTVNTTGGTPIYNYAWSDLYATGQDFSSTNQTTGDLYANDEYQVVVTDANGCSASDGFVYYQGDPNDDYDNEPSEITIGSVATDSSCVGSNSGIITVNGVAGGTPDNVTYPTTGYGYVVVDSGDPEPAAGAFSDGNIINNLAIGAYDVWVIDGNDCKTMYSSTVNIYEATPPTAEAGAPDAVCKGDDYTMPNGHASASEYSSLLWTSPDGTGTFSNELTLEPTYTPSAADITAGSVTLRLTAYGNATCSETFDEMTLTLKDIPTPSAGLDDNACGNNTTLDGTRSAGGSSLTWSQVSGPGTSSFSNTGLADPLVTVNAYGTYQFQLEENDGGCTGTATVDITFIESPSANAGANADICVGETYTLSNASASAYDNLLWETSGTGTFSQDDIENPTYTPSAADETAGTVTLTLTASETSGTCADAVSNMTLTINEVPAPDAGANDETCGKTYDLDGTQDIGGSTLSWTKIAGPGAAVFTDSQTEDPSVTVTVFGLYTFQLEENASGCTGTATVDINFRSSPTANAGSNDAICAGETYTLSSATAANYDELLWSTSGTGTFSSDDILNPVYTPSAADEGNGSVVLTLTASQNPATCPAAVANMTLTINAIPTPNAGPDDATCGLSYALNGTLSQAGSVVWSTLAAPGGGTASFNNTTTVDPTVTVTAFGTYTFQLEETANGCPGSATVDVEFVDAPVANAGSDDDICVGDTYTLSGATASNYDDLEWTTSGTGTFSNDLNLNPIYTPSAADETAGTVDLTLTASQAAGTCPDAVSTMTLTINPLPVPTITGSNNTCLNSTETYTTEGGMTAYNWTIVGGNILSGGTTEEVTVEWTATGGQSISVNYTNGNSCTGAAPTTLNVNVNENPTGNLPATATTCINQDLGLNGNPADGTGPYAAHLWTDAGAAFLNDPTIVDPTFNCPTPGNYDLTYTVTDANSCEGSDNMTITVLDGPSSNAGPDTTICHTGDYEILEATASNYEDLLWTTSGDGTFSATDVLNPVYTPGSADQTAGSVTLTLEASNTTCGGVTDDMVLTIAPELVASVGSVSPFLIDQNTTEINVTFWATHENIAQLGFYLLAPDGVTKLRLYQHNIDGTGCSLLTRNDIDSLTFSTESSDALNFCPNNSPVVTGTFDITEPGGWAALDGMDPAEGGWSLVIEDVFATRTGELTRARISFKDINLNGEEQEIVFDSKQINYPIQDNSTTTYVVPIGLRTNCSGACDARAIVSVTGGTPPYVSYVWSTGDTGDEVDLCGGDHTVTVTDSRGCTSEATVEVLEPDPIVLSFDSTNVACYGDSSGMVKVTATQGVGNYYYLWDDGDASTTAQVNNLPAGTYTVTVSDDNSCQTIGSVTITEPSAPISVSNVVIDSTNCNAETGVITITAAGGTPFIVSDTIPYQVELDGVAVAHPITGLGVGSYVVTIIDSLGCSLDTTITMVDKGDMVISGFTMLTEVACYGDCNGEVQVDFTGGTGNFSYAWSGGEINGTNQSLANVCGDSTYTVIITDDNTTCSVTDSYTIPQPTPLQITKIDSTNVRCNGDSTGTAEVIGTGGTSPYRYAWYTPTNDTLSTIETANNLPFGFIYINVKDANDCSATDSIFIDEPTQLTATKDSTPSDCGAATGTATIIPAGGTPFTVGDAYIYLWDDDVSQTTATATGLAAGIYHVTVTDSLGCSITDSITIVDNTTLAVTVDNFTDATCTGECDGTAEISVTGASGNVSFTWSSGEETQNAVELCAGINYVTVTDENSCTAIAEVIIDEPSPLDVSHTTNDPSCVGSDDGSGEILVSGGTQPYNFVWPNNESITESASDLTAGTYVVTVSDANSCGPIEETLILTDPDTIKFDLTFTATNCGDSTGSATISNITGGTGDPANYSIAWSHPDWTVDSTGTSLNNLWVDYFTVVVTDENGCTQDSVFSIIDNSTIDLIVDTIYHVTCNGAANGGAEVSSTGTTNPIFTWNNGQTGPVLSNVAAGTYTVKLTDGSCERNQIVDITEPDTIQNDIILTTTLCAGDATASFYAETSGGTGDYTYIWTNTASDTVSVMDTVIDVAPDWYFVEIYDENMCLYNDSIEIIEPDSIKLTVTTTETACDDSTGTATVSATGGLAPYSYYWYLLKDESIVLANNDQAAIGDLWVDVFVVQVTDSLGCVAYDTVEIKDVSNIDFSYNVINHVSCLSQCDGSVALTNPIGGTTDGSDFGYDVTWDNGEAGDTAFALCVGFTNVTVTDAIGCKAVKAIEITDEDALTITNIMRQNNINASGDCNGNAEVEVSGGVDDEGAYNYDYAWSNGESTKKITGLCEGWYYVTVTDLNNTNGCQVNDSVYIAKDPLRYMIADMDSVKCFGDSTGYITIQALGGYPGGYVYNWSTGQVDNTLNSSTIDSLVAGWYYFTISEEFGLNAINDSIQITQPDLYHPEYNITATHCYDSSGVIEINEGLSTGGTKPFVYEWSHPTWASFPDADSSGMNISNLWVSDYFVTITDSNECQVIDTVFMPDDSDFNIDLQITSEVRCYDWNTGELATNPENGATPYNFSWSTGDEGEEYENLTSLVAGNYAVTVTDNEQCVRTDSIVLTQPDPITFSLKDTVINHCFADTSGSVKFDTIAGGNGTPFRFFLMDGTDTVKMTTDSMFMNIHTGNYQILVQDDEGCPSSKLAFDFDSVKPPFKFTIKDTVLNFCHYDDSGSISLDTIMAESYRAPFNFQLVYDFDVIKESTDSVLNNINTGYYSLRVQDTFGCYSESIDFNLPSKYPMLIPDFVDMELASCEELTAEGVPSADGSITLNLEQVSGTVTPLTYNYIWDGDSDKTGETLTGAEHGEHSVVVSMDNERHCPQTFETEIGFRYERILNDAFFYNDDLDTVLYSCPGDTIYAGIIHDRTVTDSLLWTSKVGNTILTNPRDENGFVELRPDSINTYVVNVYHQGCLDKDSVKAFVYKIDPQLEASIEEDKTEVFEGDQIKLMANEPLVTGYHEDFIPVTHNYTWQVFPMDTAVLANADTSETLAYPTYELTRFLVTDTLSINDSRFDTLVCVLQDSLSINVFSNFNPPTGFSPNGDGTNDTWDIGLGNSREVTLKIFNRWGGQVWEYSGIYSDDKWWDGTHKNGKPLPSGTYYYSVTYKVDTGSKSETGSITILR